MAFLEGEQINRSRFTDFLRVNTTTQAASLMIDQIGFVILPSLSTADDAWRGEMGGGTRVVGMSQESEWLDVGTQLWYGGTFPDVEQWVSGLLSVPDTIVENGYTHLALHLDTAETIGGSSNVDFRLHIRTACDELGVVEENIPGENEGKLLHIFFGDHTQLVDNEQLLMVRIPKKFQRDRYRGIYHHERTQSEQSHLKDILAQNGIILKDVKQLALSARAQTFHVEAENLISQYPHGVVVKILESPETHHLPDALRQRQYLRSFGKRIAVQPIESGMIYDMLIREYSAQRVIITPFMPYKDLSELLWRLPQKKEQKIIPVGRVGLEWISRMLIKKQSLYDYYRDQFIYHIQYGISKGLLLTDVRKSNFLLDTPIETILASKKSTGSLLLCDVEHVLTQDSLGTLWDERVNEVFARMDIIMPKK
jgi:hypothetical protein